MLGQVAAEDSRLRIDGRFYKGRPLAHWVEQLIESLRIDAEPDPAVWEALGKIGAPAVPIVIRRFLEERATLELADTLDLLNMVNGIGGDDERGLFEVLRAGRDEEKLVAIEALFWSNPPTAGWRDSADALLASTDEKLRLRTALVLSKYRQHRDPALRLLLESVDRRDDSYEGIAAVRALGGYSDRADLVTPRLAGLLGCSRELVLATHAAMRELAPHSQQAQSIIARAFQSGEPLHRRGALRAVTRMENITVDDLRRVASLIDDTDPWIGKDAYRLLRREWDKEEPRGLFDEAFVHPNRKVRVLACATAVRSKPPPLDGLVICLDDEWEDVASQAHATMERLITERPSLAKELLEDARNKLHPRHTELLWILLRAGESCAPQLLVELGQTVQVALAIGPEASFAADKLDPGLAHFLVTGQTKEMFDKIQDRLKQGISDGCEIAEKLGRDAAPLAPGVIALLDSPRHQVKLKAIAALGSIGLPAAEGGVPKLLKLLRGHQNSRHSPPYVTARRAAAALAHLDVSNTEMDSILRDIVRTPYPHDEHVWAGTLRYHWKHQLMTVEEVVRRCITPPTQLRNPEQVPLIRLLAEIGPPANSALPWIETLHAERRDYLVTRAAELAIRAIRNQ